MRHIAEFVAVLACGLFAGAAVYLSLVEHPARMECGMELAATEFAPSYRRATVMQASLAAVGLVSSIAAWLAGASFLWVVAGLLLGSVIPFTLIVILPTNKQLLSPALDRRSAQSGKALRFMHSEWMPLPFGPPSDSVPGWSGSCTGIRRLWPCRWNRSRLATGSMEWKK